MSTDTTRTAGDDLAPPEVGEVGDVLSRLAENGYAVIHRVLDPATLKDLQWRLQRLLDAERAALDDADAATAETDVADDSGWYGGVFGVDQADRRRLAARQRRQREAEFDTPWPVPEEQACISFVHIPTFFDGGRSQRIFNLLNKDPAFAVLAEHPLVLGVTDALLGRDAVMLDASVNAVGAHTSNGGWHVDSPLTQVPEPLPDLTLSLQTVWMLDDFEVSNGATHVVAGSHRSLRKPPRGDAALDGEVVLEGPAGSLAIWYSQTWHRHAANQTDGVRRGVIMQYGRCWVKPFVDQRSPLSAEDAARFSPRLRYMMGCNANAPVRG